MRFAPSIDIIEALQKEGAKIKAYDPQAVEKAPDREPKQRERRPAATGTGGVRYDQTLAQELSGKKGIIILCGHYEGVDERVSRGLAPLEISIGDYVLTGGEVPAMVLLDSVTRLIPGVLGSQESLVQESFSTGTLEYPQYTRPQETHGMKVPDILLSGDHEKIAKWRQEQAWDRTQARRPDLAGKNFPDL
jgi:tRNA (guanine37-N1)-methyltransferase